MNLPPRLVKVVEKKVASGRYKSALEVLRRAFEALDAIEREDEEILRNIALSMEEYKRGEYSPAEVVFKRIEAKLGIRRGRFNR